MTDDRGKSKKEKRFEKAKGRLQQSFPVQHLVRRSGAVEIAQSLFRQFADDIQLKDLLAKAEALVVGSKDAPPTAMFRDVTPANESPKSVEENKTPSKGARLRKAAPKKASSKKTTKRAPKRKAKARA
jgi:hypothetical protein